jgi:outer membrane protein assembly factor BamB
MSSIRRTGCAALLFLAGGMSWTGPAWAQVGVVASGGRFELADNVQLDQVDNATEAQQQRIKTLLADRQWDEAVEILRQLAESSDGKLTPVTTRRFVALRAWCQMQLATLPPDALKLYRARVDSVARKWYEQGVAERNRRLLENIIEQTFASTYGDAALLALGDMALESGDYSSARWGWERIVPVAAPADALRIWPGYPDSRLDLAAVRARLVLASLLEGLTDRARAELAEFTRLHPAARGRLGHDEGKFTDLLSALLTESASWPAPTAAKDWLTFAGDPQRNRIAPPLVDVGSVAWRVRLSAAGAPRAAAFESRRTDEDPAAPLSFHPLLVGNTVLVNDGQRILALRLDTGKPAWGQAVVYQSELNGVVAPSVPPDMLGLPRFTMTVFQRRLLARMGSPVTGQPQGTTPTGRPGYLVCLDLAAEGRLLWKAEPEEGWAFEGSPVADTRGVYVAMRRQDIRPQAFVACFDPDSGRLRWRRFICGAETPARGLVCEGTHNLLTLVGDTLYYNTNLGAVAAVDTDDGRPLWVSLYPRARRGELSKLDPHWRRDLNPCLLNHGTLLVAPADSPRIFAFDAATGQALWQTGSEVEDATHLLGTVGDWLIAGGRRLYWISLKDEDRGRVKHVWPDGGDRPGYGRGVLTGDIVLWPTRDKLYAFDQQTGQPRKVVDLRARGLSGGNLLAADGRLLVATGTELVALDPHAGEVPEKTDRINVVSLFRGR